MAHDSINEFIGMITTVKIGNLYLRLETSRKPFNPDLSITFTKFSLPTLSEPNPDLAEQTSLPMLVLTEAGKPLNIDSGKRLLYNETTNIWEDEQSNFTFQLKSYNRVFLTTRVDKNFKEGQFQYANADVDPAEIALMDLFDLRLYLNWLANFGDLVLHASGFVFEGKGYCFLGESGRGKSTLVRDLVGRDGLIVLGEDQVILRYLDGQFRIFGTPWHTDPNYCSSLDAPLEKMFFLDRLQPQKITEMTPLEVTSRVLQTAFVPWYRKECLPLILERVALLPQSASCLTLSYKLGQDGLETLLDA